MNISGLSPVLAACVLSLTAFAAPQGVTPISGVPWQPPKDQPKVIYGTDDRIDVYQETDSVRIGMAQSTCALVSSGDVINHGDGTYRLNFSLYEGGLGVPACPGERFGTQPVAAYCTGFMVGDDIIATAGHCLDDTSLSSTKMVFGFVMEDASTPASVYPASLVYTPVEILGHALEGDLDYTITRVDRPITAPGAHALPIRRSGVIDIGAQVGLIGHPAGLPMKIAFGDTTTVRGNLVPGYFTANTDSYGGNSGSPVFNQITGVVEGILVRGDADFALSGNCFVSRVVSDSGGSGEDVSKSTSFAQFVPELATSAGVLLTGAGTVQCGGTINLTLRDLDLDGSPSTTITAVTSNFDSEIVTLTASPGVAGTFTGSIGVNQGNPQAGNHVIEVNTNGLITFSYHDVNDGSGNTANVSKSVALDCLPPALLGLHVDYAGSSQATISFTTTEPATSVLHFGSRCDNLNAQSTSVLGTTHRIGLSGLPPSSTVFYRIEVTDAAGNSAGFDNGGLCYQFDTVAALDYFTEFRSASAKDLAFHRLLFTPSATNDGYTACTSTAAAFATDTAGSTAISLTDDGVAALDLADARTFPFYGESFNQVQVCANGFVTLGGVDTSYEESLAQHFAFKRISAFFHDLSPNLRGTVSYKQTADRLAITWVNVPEYTNTTLLPSNAQNFQIELYFDGRIGLTYLSLSATSAVAGLSRGLGLADDFQPSNLLGYADCSTNDSDADGLPDDWESRTGLNPNSDAGNDGAAGDPDGDGLNNLQEFARGTHPLRPDSDFDGVNDGDEVTAGTDPTGTGGFHSADSNEDGHISLSEILRIIQFYNLETIHCDASTEDGYAVNAGDESCHRHHSDYKDPAWQIDLSEVLRAIQLYHASGYTRDIYSEDSFAGVFAR